MSVTRRGLLGGAVASAPLLGRAVAAAAPAAAPWPARRRVVLRGRDLAVSADGRTLVAAHDLRRTVAVGRDGRARVVDVGGQPVAVAVAPDGGTAAVVTGFYDTPALLLLALPSGRVLARRKAGPAPTDVAFTPDGRRIVVVGGEQEGTLAVFDARHLERVSETVIGRVPRAVAVGGELAWVSLQADDRVVAVDLHRARVRREVRTPTLPDRIALSPDARRLLVTHAGRADERVTELDLATGATHRHGAGRHPSGVAWTSAGRRLVALGGEAAVLRLEGRRRRSVGAAPRGLATAGRRFFTVSALDGAISAGRA